MAGARQEARRASCDAKPNANGGGAAKGQPNERAHGGLAAEMGRAAARHVARGTASSFMQNNAQFQNLPPAATGADQARISRNGTGCLRSRKTRFASDGADARKHDSGAARVLSEARCCRSGSDAAEPRARRLTAIWRMLQRMSPAEQQAALNDPEVHARLEPGRAIDAARPEFAAKSACRSSAFVSSSSSATRSAYRFETDFALVALLTLTKHFHVYRGFDR